MWKYIIITLLLFSNAYAGEIYQEPTVGNSTDHAIIIPGDVVSLITVDDRGNTSQYDLTVMFIRKTDTGKYLAVKSTIDGEPLSIHIPNHY